MFAKLRSFVRRPVLFYGNSGVQAKPVKKLTYSITTVINVLPQMGAGFIDAIITVQSDDDTWLPCA